jgi:hypothetical protein
MLPATLTPRRKLALGLAIPWFAFMLAVGLHILHFGAGQMPFVHWQLPVTAAWIVASSIASGLLITEMVRLTMRSSAAWSDSHHFAFALIVSSALLGVQSLSLWLAFHVWGARAF